jgi:hypothetical protein
MEPTLTPETDIDSDSSAASKFSRLAKTVVLAFRGETDPGLTAQEHRELKEKIESDRQAEDKTVMTVSEARRTYITPLADILARTNHPLF